jgi:hypothetical protein
LGGCPYPWNGRPRERVWLRPPEADRPPLGRLHGTGRRNASRMQGTRATETSRRENFRMPPAPHRDRLQRRCSSDGEPTHTSDDAVAARPLAPGPAPRVPPAPPARRRPTLHPDAGNL